MDLIEFLRARLDEDERAAVDANADALRDQEKSGRNMPHADWYANNSDSNGDDIVAMHPSRALAEVAAKRAILDLTDRADIVLGDQIVKALAQPYADHPDYQPEWKP